MDKHADQFEEDLLWQGIQKGDLHSFEKLYNRFFKDLFSYGNKICFNRNVVEDAIHDMFLDVWKYHSTLSYTTSVRFYLYSALRRRIIKNQQKDTDSFVFTGDENDFMIKKSFSHEESIIQNEIQTGKASDLKRRLSNLPERQSKALVLRFYDEFSYSEIAELLGVNEQSARNLIQRGLENLRKVAKILLAGFLVCLAL